VLLVGHLSRRDSRSGNLNWRHVYLTPKAAKDRLGTQQVRALGLRAVLGLSERCQWLLRQLMADSEPPVNASISSASDAQQLQLPAGWEPEQVISPHRHPTLHPSTRRQLQQSWTYRPLSRRTHAATPPPALQAMFHRPQPGLRGIRGAWDEAWAGAVTACGHSPDRGPRCCWDPTSRAIASRRNRS